MSQVGAVTHGKDITVSDGAYLERSDTKELAAEQWLRAAFARVPNPFARRKPWLAFAREVGRHEDAVRALDDEGLRARFRQACQGMRKGGMQGEPASLAFACIRDASRRVLGMRHHDVQIAGGWALLQGMIAEMATGEGKTLVAALGASCAAGTGAATHVVTVNDYLAERDAEQNRPLYELLGLSLGAIKADMTPEQRREQYARDVVYVSNKELVFDYLKDRLATQGMVGSHLPLRALAGRGGSAAVLLRGLHVAIVDEADSVLIDEARTPLIISETQPDELGEAVYARAMELAARLEPGRHYEVSPDRQVFVNDAADADVAGWTHELPGLWQSAVWRRELIQKALSALHLFHRDQHYIVAEGKVQIVDEFTGRVMPDRSWERGLHQMIESKEGVEITGQRKTLAQMTYQRFFRRYLLLAGMTGTAQEIATELRGTYDLRVLPIPTHKPSRRRHLPHECWASVRQRDESVAAKAEAISKTGRPVLVGTRSVEASETLGKLLEERGIAHTVLNARQDKSEAEAVERGGEAGQITVATNMAGRGTDIKLAPGVDERGGLHVILTEFHESARVDRQLFGRCARQGNAGSTEAVVTVDDELFVRFGWPLRQLAVAAGKPGSPLPRWLLKAMVRIAQSRAERHNRRIRMDTMKQDRKRLEQMGFTGKGI